MLKIWVKSLLKKVKFKKEYEKRHFNHKFSNLKIDNVSSKPKNKVKNKKIKKSISIDNKVEAKPFLKWAGGKRGLLEQFNEHFPQKLKNNEILYYVEPFLGGGSVFFELRKDYNFKKVVLNDINIELIATYKAIQYDADNLISILKKMKENYLKLDETQRQEYYYKIRSEFNKENVKIKNNHYDILKKIESGKCFEHVAKLIFLNKTCFNGLYRLNSKGEFNVPFGRYKNPEIFDEKNLKNVSLALKGVILNCGNYKSVEKYGPLNNHTFVYMDPPYRPISETSNFNSYSDSLFGESEQIELSNWFKKLDKKGVFLMLSNSDPSNINPKDKFFQNHFKGYKIDKVYASRNINSKVENRKKITELVIKNY